MAKTQDPALLWYPGDYIAGTAEYSFEEKGAYIDILMKQFQHGGPLPEEKIKRILRDRYHAIWEVIKEKFKQDEKGNWYNERLEKERIKRQNFTKSRRENLEKKKENPHIIPHTEPHKETHTGQRMENENENGNTNGFEYHLKESEKKVEKIEIQVDRIFLEVFDSLYMERDVAMVYRGVDVTDQLEKFKAKVRGAPGEYRLNDDNYSARLRNAFQYQLRQVKPEKKVQPKKKLNFNDLNR